MSSSPALLLHVTAHWAPPPFPNGRVSRATRRRRPLLLVSPNSNNKSGMFRAPCSFQHQPQVDRISSDDDAVQDVPVPSPSGGSEKSDINEKGQLSSNKLLLKLKRYGVAGVLSYGLLNTVYYSTTFLLVWFYFAPAPSKLGYAAAVQRFVKIMAMVWAGSQVTKIVRAGGALALAPFVDKALSWFTVRFKFESEGKAFAVIVGFCFALALLLFVSLTLLWA